MAMQIFKKTAKAVVIITKLIIYVSTNLPLCGKEHQKKLSHNKLKKL